MGWKKGFNRTYRHGGPSPLINSSMTVRKSHLSLTDASETRSSHFKSVEVRVVSYNVCGFGAGFGDVDERMVTEVPHTNEGALGTLVIR